MNSNLQKKLFHFEAPPPKGSWEKLAEALDNENSFAQRLYHYEQTPSPQTWSVVEAALNETQTPAKVVSFFSRYKSPLRYVAAASIIAVTLVAVSLSIKHTQAGSLVGKNEAVNRIEKIKQQATEEKPSNTFGLQSPILAAAPTIREENKSRFAAVKRTLAYITPQSIFPTLSLRRSFIPKQVQEKVLFDQSSQENFMVYSDGDGNVMKLPKKLFSLVCCKDGDASCKLRLQHLRQTLSANVASADFTGMIDMLRQLQ